MLRWTKARHLPACEWVCLSVFLRVCVFLCVAAGDKRWQRAMVLTQKWARSWCVCACVRVACVRACVCVCVSPRYDGDSWGGTGRCSTPFHPDALVTLWSCSLLSTSPCTRHEVAGGWRVGDFGRVKLVTHTRGTATLPWVQTPESRAMHVGILRSKNQL